MLACAGVPPYRMDHAWQPAQQREHQVEPEVCVQLVTHNQHLRRFGFV